MSVWSDLPFTPKNGKNFNFLREILNFTSCQLSYLKFGQKLHLVIEKNNFTEGPRGPLYTASGNVVQVMFFDNISFQSTYFEYAI